MYLLTRKKPFNAEDWPMGGGDEAVRVLWNVVRTESISKLNTKFKKCTQDLVRV